MHEKKLPSSLQSDSLRDTQPRERGNGSRHVLRNIKALENYEVRAADGKLGLIRDFYFDKKHWAVRYFVVDTIGFLSEHWALVSPIDCEKIDWKTRQFHLASTREKVNNSPPFDLQRPITLQYEKEYFEYYGWSHYWGAGGSGVWSGKANPRSLVHGPLGNASPTYDEDSDHELRSIRQVTGYRVLASDGDIGGVEDFIVDDKTWAIRYLVIDCPNWWLDRKVLVEPCWAHHVGWAERNFFVNLPREVIKNSPEWRPGMPVNREYKKRLFDYYSLSGYLCDQGGVRAA